MIEKIDSWNIKGIMEQPILVLGEKIRPWVDIDYSDYKFTKERKWYHIYHQAGGVGCLHPQMIGTIIEVSDSTKRKFKQLHDKYYDTSMGIFGVTLDELIEYRSDLNNILEVDCNINHKSLMEAFYPIDPLFVHKLSSESLPEENLEFFVGGKTVIKKYKENKTLTSKEMEVLINSIREWSLYIIGYNSD